MKNRRRSKREKDRDEITRFIFYAIYNNAFETTVDSSGLRMRYLDRLVLLDISRYTFSTATLLYSTTRCAARLWSLHFSLFLSLSLGFPHNSPPQCRLTTLLLRGLPYVVDHSNIPNGKSPLFSHTRAGRSEKWMRYKICHSRFI